MERRSKLGAIVSHGRMLHYLVELDLDLPIGASVNHVEIKQGWYNIDEIYILAAREAWKLEGRHCYRVISSARRII